MDSSTETTSTTLLTCSTSILADSQQIGMPCLQQWQHSENSYNTSAMASTHDSDSISDSAQLVLPIALWKCFVLTKKCFKDGGHPLKWRSDGSDYRRLGVIQLPSDLVLKIAWWSGLRVERMWEFLCSDVGAGTTRVWRHAHPLGRRYAHAIQLK